MSADLADLLALVQHRRILADVRLQLQNTIDVAAPRAHRLAGRRDALAEIEHEIRVIASAYCVADRIMEGS